MIARMTVPELFEQRASALLDDDAAWRPPACRHAATLALLRPSEDGFEVLVQQRSSSMKFAPSMYVFPGGAVEASDLAAAQGLNWTRQHFRTGVDLSGPDEQPDPPSTAALAVAASREADEEAGIRVPVADLVPIAHWLTPAVEPRRFDTRFFAAVVPAGQPIRDESGETTTSLWLHPQAAIQAWREGRMPMLPPTVSVLRQLARSASLHQALEASPEDLRPILPHPYRAGSEVRWRLVDAYTGEPLAGDPWPMP